MLNPRRTTSKPLLWVQAARRCTEEPFSKGKGVQIRPDYAPTGEAALRPVVLRSPTAATVYPSGAGAGLCFLIAEINRRQSGAFREMDAHEGRLPLLASPRWHLGAVEQRDAFCFSVMHIIVHY